MPGHDWLHVLCVCFACGGDAIITVFDMLLLQSQIGATADGAQDGVLTQLCHATDSDVLPVFCNGDRRLRRNRKMLSAARGRSLRQL